MPSQRVQNASNTIGTLAGFRSSVISVGDWISTRGGILIRCVSDGLPPSNSECTIVNSDHLAMKDEPLATVLEMPLTTT